MTLLLGSGETGQSRMCSELVPPLTQSFTMNKTDDCA